MWLCLAVGASSGGGLGCGRVPILFARLFFFFKQKTAYEIGAYEYSSSGISSLPNIGLPSAASRLRPLPSWSDWPFRRSFMSQRVFLRTELRMTTEPM